MPPTSSLDLKLMVLKDEVFLTRNGFLENLDVRGRLHVGYYMKSGSHSRMSLVVQITSDDVVQSYYVVVPINPFIVKVVVTYYYNTKVISRDTFRKIIRDANNARGESREA